MTSRYNRLQYHVKDLPIEEFKAADTLVRATLLSGGKGYYTNFPRIVTTDYEQLAKKDQIECDSSYDGWCFSPSNVSNNFDIWLHPKLYTIHGAHQFRMTLLHELCHGHVGLGYGHKEKWRRVFGRVLIHYNSIVEPLPALGFLKFTLMRYTIRSKSEAIPDKKLRVRNELNSIKNAAVREQGRVADLYQYLSKREECFD